MLKSADIEKLVLEAGFDLCGITRAEHLGESERHFRSWLKRGYDGELKYLRRYEDLRFDPSKLVEGSRTVIVCGVNYKNEFSLGQDLSEGCGIASYALMRDYHKTIRKALKGVLSKLTDIYPHISGRVFTDSAPLLEKALAVRAGLGWIGHQSLVVTPRYGTFVLLGEILIDDEVETYNNTIIESRCGTCRLCIESCPAKAINDDFTIDTRRCIACRTIEVDDTGDEPLAGWIFGCDICQSCCPHNQKSPIAHNPNMKLRITPPSRAEWQSMSQSDFEKFAEGTPLRRSSLERIRSLQKIEL